LFIAQRTVAAHLDHIRSKLGVPTRTAAAVRSPADGLAEVPIDTRARRLIRWIEARARSTEPGRPQTSIRSAMGEDNAMPKAVGIDLGTTNSVIATVEGGERGARR